MKTKSLLFSITLLTGLLFVSCDKKEKAVSPEPPVTHTPTDTLFPSGRQGQLDWQGPPPDTTPRYFADCLLKQTFDDGGIITFSYDALDRRVTETHNGGYVRAWSYKGSDSKPYVMMVTKDGKRLSRTEFIHDIDGRLTESPTYYYYSDGTGEEEVTRAFYTYSGGLLQSRKHVEAGKQFARYEFTYNSLGEAVQINIYDKNDVLTEQRYMTYDGKQKPNSGLSEFYDQGVQLLGEWNEVYNSKSNLASLICKSSGGVETRNITYTYTYSADGYPIMVMGPMTYELDYFCK
jgi:YD repeat-containing protein